MPQASPGRAPVETKVKAGAAGAALAGLAVWALNTYVFHGALPAPVDGAVLTLVPGLIAGVSGWLARHAPR